MQRRVVHRFIDEDLAVAYLEIKETVWVCTDPGFILHGRALPSEVRQRDQVTFLALLALGKM
jgi:hypothetical protein